MFCLYLNILFNCRHVTETENITTATSKNGRLMRHGECITCGKTNTQFVKRGAAGGSFLNNFVNKLPFEMHLPGHNFTGAGLKLYKSLNSDETPKEWSIPINRVDNADYHHDLCYSEHDDTKTRNEVCDKTMLNELNEIATTTLRKRTDKSIIGKLINSNVNFGLAAPIKAKNPTIY